MQRSEHRFNVTPPWDHGGMTEIKKKAPGKSYRKSLPYAELVAEPAA